MIYFRDFTVPLWKIFGGNLLMLVTIGLYIAWWTVTFRPNRAGRPARSGFFLALALPAGAAAILTLFSGIGALFETANGSPVISILLGAAVVYIVLLAVTRIIFRRPITAELLLLTVWAALQGSAIAVLWASNRLGFGATLTLAALMILATATGLVCYILHYRLDEIPRFWNGLIPLIVDAGLVTVFLGMLALS